ncbi:MULTISPECIES: SPOR domain-containing protein [Halomonadaceae]|uniref:SPOR domain-containing protein n=1 Tax=Halomonadaceae TaxID=28256 RepID=UPI00159ABAC2|nr:MULTISPECIES: SPOR domain-containing protein [Halomonas]QJQ94039.1 acetyl-CoA carboxylase subunit beta [Halomonas sp. PA5]
MKYGMRERISGAVIIVALGVIFVPMLFDEPTPREERPQPVLTIDQPIQVNRTPVAEPQPPASLSTPAGPSMDPPPEVDPRQVVAETQPLREPLAEVSEPDTRDAAEQSSQGQDPIAELAQSAQPVPAQTGSAAQPEPAPAQGAGPTAATPGGGWEVQVGSFGEPANAERLESQLTEQGFRAYKRARDNNLTTVYVGPYDSSEAGEQARTELKARANIQGLLVRTREGG